MGSKKEKLINRLKSKPKDFKWSELKALLISLGYQEYNAGNTSGSRVRFCLDGKHTIMLHKPHPTPVLKPYQVKQVLEQLIKEGLI
ncbi:type II toxin-antitoxin system HicA family toxin [Facilibium subflavum]|uniref:type II toxin-antitoxin system HicA family toxin n=1 Tax=Facilibium subflavum TaxID=2219058 RepID=UPI000E659BD0|nr:type II toxin-antitoxin system HicA family toxin [Facilibium subflavum]